MSDDARVAALEARIVALEAVIASLRSAFGGGGAGANGGARVAPDVDLDGRWGDEEIRIGTVRGWEGRSMKGYRMSDCPPEFLDLFADAMTWFAKKADEKNEMWKGTPVSKYNLRSAGRARGWAARLRSGWTRPPQQTQAAPEGRPSWMDAAPPQGSAPSEEDLRFPV